MPSIPSWTCESSIPQLPELSIFHNWIISYQPYKDKVLCPEHLKENSSLYLRESKQSLAFHLHTFACIFVPGAKRQLAKSWILVQLASRFSLSVFGMSGAQLISNGLLISALQPSDSVASFFFFISLSTIGRYKTLNVVPSSALWVFTYLCTVRVYCLSVSVAFPFG